MRRREFIAALGGAAAMPFVVRAQERMRRIGALMPTAERDAQGLARFATFLDGLQQAGWKPGVNIQVETRWTSGRPEDIRKYAAELLTLAPDVIFSAGGPNMEALYQATKSIPIVFVSVADPVAAGFVDSLASPGGNITGFMNTEYGLSAKWLELLKQIAPSVTRVAVLRDPTNRSGLGQVGALQSVAASFGVEVVPLGMRDANEVERGVGIFAGSPGGGMIVPAGAAGAIYRDVLISLASQHRLPTVYSDRVFIRGGGLCSYGPDRESAYRNAGAYVGRILKGEKAAELPVQAPTKYELAINLKTARALGLTIPSTLISLADEVIE
jgi:putative ABC transport system substrate-binding protein